VRFPGSGGALQGERADVDLDGFVAELGETTT
jgi:hypothetical protein